MYTPIFSIDKKKLIKNESEIPFLSELSTLSYFNANKEYSAHRDFTQIVRFLNRKHITVRKKRFQKTKPTLLSELTKVLSPFENHATVWIGSPYCVLNEKQSHVIQTLLISKDENETINKCGLTPVQFGYIVNKAIIRLKYPDVCSNFDWWLNHHNKSDRDQFLHAPLNNGLKKTLPFALIQKLNYMGNSISEILDYYHNDNIKSILGVNQFKEFKKYLKKFNCLDLLKPGYSPYK